MNYDDSVIISNGTFPKTSSHFFSMSFSKVVYFFLHSFTVSLLSKSILKDSFMSLLLFSFFHEDMVSAVAYINDSCC